VYSASADGTARIWDPIGLHPVVLRGHSGLIKTLEVRRDGRMVVTASADRTARLWDAETGQSRVLPRHEDMVVFAAYTDDEHVITVDHGGTITEFPDDIPADRAGFAAWLAAAIR
jgi:WD40 repeat protein